MTNAHIMYVEGKPCLQAELGSADPLILLANLSATSFDLPYEDTPADWCFSSEAANYAGPRRQETSVDLLLPWECRVGRS